MSQLGELGMDFFNTFTFRGSGGSMMTRSIQ